MESSIAVFLMRQLAHEQLPTLLAMCCMTMLEEAMPLNLRICFLKKYKFSTLMFCFMILFLLFFCLERGVAPCSSLQLLESKTASLKLLP